MLRGELGRGEDNTLEELLSYFNPWETMTFYSTMKSTVLLGEKQIIHKEERRGERFVILTVKMHHGLCLNTILMNCS